MTFHICVCHSCRKSTNRYQAVYPTSSVNMFINTTATHVDFVPSNFRCTSKRIGTVAARLTNERKEPNGRTDALLQNTDNAVSTLADVSKSLLSEMKCESDVSVLDVSNSSCSNCRPHLGQEKAVTEHWLPQSAHRARAMLLILSRYVSAAARTGQREMMLRMNTL